MKYSELITKRKQYKYSANICFDLENENRLSGFIPNVTTTEILKEYLYGIIQDKAGVHSRILYGSYGTGKSHLLTVLCALLGHINTNGDAFDLFIESITKYDDDFADFIKEFAKNAKPYLVVPVYSDFSDFDKCISYSMKKALEKKGFEICFKNTFYEALDLIAKWEDGEASKTRLDEVCNKLKVDISDFKNQLKTFVPSSEKVFNLIFKEMTYGATFVSETGSLIDNLNQANEAIKDEYQGIVFVFDEFGRYIEDNGETIKVKTIQDFAEYCDHSDYENHLILVSHKQLSLYTDKMKKELSDEWKKIEGRFKATSINVKYDQCLSLIPHIIPKTKKWDTFKKRYERDLNALYEEAWDFKGFLLPPEGGNPFEGGFPLHPITLYALDRLSKKVAQNERTFFTYLASDEENSLFAQIDKLKDDRFHFVGLDLIYDYFEENIMSYRANDIYVMYKKLQYALNKLGEENTDSAEVKILKTIAVINIISDSAVLASNRVTLCHVIDEDDEVISSAIDALEKKKIIKFMRQYGYYDFLDSSIYDLDSMIEEKIGSINDEMVVNILNDEFTDFVIYPHRYNAKYHMNRIMIPVFAYRNELSKKTFVRSMPDYYDGIVAFVLDADYSLNEYSEVELPDRMLMLVNSNPKQIINEVKRYIATKLLYSQREELKKDDPTVEKELQLYLEEEQAILSELVSNWRKIKGSDITVVFDGHEEEVKSEAELTECASQIMLSAYKKTIIVNNDLINKNKVSGAIRLSRSKLLDNMLNGIDIMNGCTPLSPEHNIVRALLVKNGMYDDGIPVKLNYIDGEVSGDAVKHVIQKYIKKAKKAPVSVNELYEELKKPPYGLRDGYMSLLLAYELSQYENISLSFHGADRDYSSEEFLKAFENPEDYSIFICNWSEEQEKYISDLEELYGKYLNRKTKNRLKELLGAMNTHFASLTKSALTTDKYVSPKAKQYRDILSISYKDYNSFFFEVLPKLDSDYGTLVVQLRTIKAELERVPELQMSDVDKLIRNVFDIGRDETISMWLFDKYESEWAAKAHKVFDYHTNAFLEFVRNNNAQKEDVAVIQDLANVITGFGVDYWNDSKIEDFEEILRKVFAQLEGYTVKDELSDDEVKIVIQTGGEELRTTQFDKQDLSSNGQIMFNKMKATISNFGESISQEEKMQIIARLLEEII
ncbi:hypothetical protein ACTQ56_02920 [[Clostridium] aminophilum]|uniref:hypothetical protein n=1 Tax=[Clostridium] aminophilum TaxID=1526 RepID=UPI003F947FED